MHICKLSQLALYIVKGKERRKDNNFKIVKAKTIHIDQDIAADKVAKISLIVLLSQQKHTHTHKTT